MSRSHDSSRLRRTSSRLLAFHGLCWLVACATAVEEPTSLGTVNTDTGLASTTDGSAVTTTATSNAAPTATSAASSSLSSTSGASSNTGVSSGEAATTTSTSSSSVTNIATANSSSSSSASASTSSSTSAGGAGGATTGSFATTVTDGGGGTSATNTTSTLTNSTTGGASEYCDDALTPAENVAAEGTTGAFDTTDGLCFRLDFVPADFAGWGCSNFQASMGNRTILVNGTSVSCGELPLPEPVDGGYYFDFGPGTNVSAAVYWWNWE